MSTDSGTVAELIRDRYRHGFVTDIEADSLPPGH